MGARTQLQFLGVGLLSVGLTACASPEKQYETALRNTGKPALHAVHGKRLRTLMHRLEALMFERQRTQTEVDADRRAYLDEAQAVASSLVESATYIAQSADDLRSDERTAFESLQRKLVRQATELQTLAANGRHDAVRGQYEEIVTTCNACHASFRDFAGDEP